MVLVRPGATVVHGRMRAGGILHLERTWAGRAVAVPGTVREASALGVGMTTEVRVLGDVGVLVDGRAVGIGAARQRCVLAVLVAEANRVVTVDRLADRVWCPGRAPKDPGGVVRTYISRLRRALAVVEGVALVHQSAGYEVVVDERCVDLYRFRSLLARARSANRDDQAAALMQEALGLWRGEPFAGLDTPWLNEVRESLVVQRQAARLDLIDVQLRLGRHTELLAELVEHVAAHPLDERVAGQMMLALYRSGRQADALAQYQRIRTLLADELGADPGPALRDLHQRMLTTSPALITPASRPASSPPVVIPRQLPAAPRGFIGRARELGCLSAMLDEQADPGGTLLVSAIGGAGGVGKTWLALHWAHRNLDRFPDGQLYVNLRGFDPSGQPMPTETAVRGFLDALGVAPASVPPDLDAQVGLYRSLLTDKRILIVADNASDTAQVTALLPGSPTCTALVTSRRRLTGLVSGHGAQALYLDVLTEGEARELLASRLGEDRLAAEPGAAATLTACCAGLPLAISVAAARALSQPDLSLAALADELRDAATRLDALETGDLAANVRAVLSWSFDALGHEAVRVLGLIASAPGPDIGLPAAASLTAIPNARLRKTLRDLEHAHLLQRHGESRYRMHDLVRLYAIEHADIHQSCDDRAAALRRVVDFYLHTAYAAARLCAPHRLPIRLDDPVRGTVPYPLSDPATALAWLDAEYACLLAAQRLAGSQGWDALVWQLAWTLHTYHLRRGDAHGQVATWRFALDAARRLDDPSLQSRALCWLGHACAQVGDLAEGLEHADRALTLAEQANDTYRQALAHQTLAHIWELHGDNRQALVHARDSLRFVQMLDDPVWQTIALSNVGWCHARLGQYAEARTACQSALELQRRHHRVRGSLLDSLGYIAHHTHEYHQALSYYRQALDMCRDTGDAYYEAEFLEHVAETYLALHQSDEARDAWNQALGLYVNQHRLAHAERIRQCLAALGSDGTLMDTQH